jgi:hypothetical protein
MDISFVIITNGQKPDKVLNQILSIRALQIPNYKIILSGIHPEKFKKHDLIYVDDHHNASRGSLGGLRNSACKVAPYENIVISDDDMLFPREWYTQLLKSPSFDILTTRIVNPDGTRFWDHACYMSPTRGHSILNPDEEDDFLYMSGGQSWLMKKYVWESVQWDAELLFYNVKNLSDYNKGHHNEDTNFALRCREAGFKISHDHNVIVNHDDPSYTSIGRLVRRRSVYKDYRWVKSFLFPDEIAIEFAVNLINKGIEAEGADILRILSISGNFKAMELYMQFENLYGGALKDSNFILE